MEFCIITYILCAVSTAIIGVALMMLGSSGGRNDEEYLAGKNLLRFSPIFPYAVYKYIKNNLNKADKE